MIPTRIGESQARILEHLKRNGTGTIPEMAETLSLSVETVRTHLRSLGSERLVERRGRRSSGPGRPEIVYGLTDAAEVLFPNQEGKLLKDLAAFLAERGQSPLVHEFFEAQVSRRREAVQQRLADLAPDDRVDEVARVLSEEGFMAEVVTDDDGRKLLRLSHCPLKNLVEVTKAPCRAELAFVREALGARLGRVSYIPSGDSACCYTLKDRA